MNRRDKLLFDLHVARLQGLEIGALARPTVRATDGRIFYADYLDSEQLRDKYRYDASVDNAGIVPVAILTGGRDLADAFGDRERVDCIIASHVIDMCRTSSAGCKACEAA